MNGISVFINLIRVKQWIKNLFVFAALAFSGQFVDPSAIKSAMTAFVSLCLVSSGIYVINDLLDIQRDKHHPKKCLRPLASGQISRITAVFLAVGLLSCSIGVSYTLGRHFMFLLGLYVALNVMYNLIGKRIVLVDVGCIAIGFCIRIWACAVIIGVKPTGWLQLCVFLLALFLGFTKRRSEMIMLKGKWDDHRYVLRHYSLYFLDQLIMISATLAIVFYGLYTISPDIVAKARGYAMVYSIVFVVYGIFRYLYLVHVKKMREDPDGALMGDMPLALNILAWVAFSLWVLYR